jgi:methionyl-tRNA synthetase
LKKRHSRTLVTAALPYANGKIHLGHLAGAYLPADIYVRYLRSAKRDVLFICGSDEHGVPITITAGQEGTTPQAIVDRYHGLNLKAFERFGMSFDNYSRTSLPLHHETARDFFTRFLEQGVLREKTESQLYDAEAGMFLPDRYVEGTCPVCKNTDARGDQCEKCGTFLNPAELIDPKSKITGNKPTVKDTKHWYFPLGRFQERLEDYIAAADRRDGWKQNVLHYCQGWFREGLQDRAVTRDLDWGVRIPLAGFENKVLYVWFDAVLGYISGTKEYCARSGRPEAWRDYWQDPGTKYVAFIGKDNVVFHCIVFPAMLMAFNEFSGNEQYVLPENVPANEFLNFEGQKFSKSRGWGIDVDEFLDLFPADSLRYALTMILPESRDSDFTWRDFQARHNNELADILGNFVNRTVTFARTHFGGMVPPSPGAPLRDPSDEVAAEIGNAMDGASGAFEEYRFKEGTQTIMGLARFANKYFNDAEPWKTIKSDRDAAARSVSDCLRLVRALAILAEPVLPNASAGIWKILNLEGDPSGAGWESAAADALVPGQTLGQPEILFSKIEDKTIEDRISMLPTENGDAGSGPASLIDIDDFKKISIKIALVLEAERVPKSGKLLKLKVSIGSEERQVIAGIAKHYTPEELVGKKIVVVANLKPAKLMGLESQGMLLAASDEEGKLGILTVIGDIKEGSAVK